MAKYGANEYRYTDKKGTIYTFSPGYSIHGFYSLVMRRILSVNGEEVNISFDSSNRIRSVTHNAGYQLRYEYQYSGNTYFPTRITAVNMAVDYCDPNATSCTYSRPWRFVTYNWYISPSEQRLTVTDGGGQITRYTMDKWWRVIRVKPANADVDTIEYKYCQHDVPGGSEPITCADDPNDTMSATGRWAGRAVVYDKVYLVVRNGKNWNYSFDAYSFTSSFTAQDFRMSSEVGRSKFVRIHFSISGDVLIQQITDSDKNYAFMGGEKIGLKPLFSQTNLMSSNFMITEATSFACGNIKMAFLM